MSGRLDPLFFSKESGHESSSSSGGGGGGGSGGGGGGGGGSSGGPIKENYTYPYCPEISKYTQLAMVGQGTFG